MSDVMRWLGIAALVATEIVGLNAATITGVVWDPANYPIDRSHVWAITENCLGFRHATTDQKGRYSFEGLPGGSYRVFATSPGFWLIGERVVHLEAETTASLDLQLVVSAEDSGGSPPSMPVRGVVTDAGGRPISGARIRHSGRELEHETVSTSDGRFGFCRVSGERIDFQVEHEGYAPRKISLKPSMGQEIRLKIELKR
jgi:hypothetical protein